MARKVKKLTLAEIKRKKRDIVRNLHSLLFELERITTVDEDGRFPFCEEEEWIDDTFFMAGGVFNTLDDLTAKIYKGRK